MKYRGSEGREFFTHVIVDRDSGKVVKEGMSLEVRRGLGRILVKRAKL